MRSICCVLLVVFLGGCSETVGASRADAGTESASCAPFINAIGVAAFGCRWQEWECSADAPTSAEIDACRRRVQILESDGGVPACDAVRAEIEACGR